MPIWLKIIFGLLRAAASVTSLWNVLGKKEKISDSPFITVPIKELAAKLPSPLHVRPNKVMRGYCLETNHGLHILLGGAGVGKTREAIDYVEMLARLTGATTVYLARGYVNAMAPLPSKSDIRRIIVLLDDYDYGFPSAAAPSFDKRQAGYAEAMDNLSKLYRRIKSSIDLQALIVTVNTHRLPCTVEQEAGDTEFPPISPNKSYGHLGVVELGITRRWLDNNARWLRKSQPADMQNIGHEDTTLLSDGKRKIVPFDVEPVPKASRKSLLPPDISGNERGNRERPNTRLGFPLQSRKRI